jgi:hypothetical protein
MDKTKTIKKIYKCSYCKKSTEVVSDANAKKFPFICKHCKAEHEIIRKESYFKKKLIWDLYAKLREVIWMPNITNNYIPNENMRYILRFLVDREAITKILPCKYSFLKKQIYGWKALSKDIFKFPITYMPVYFINVEQKFLEFLIAHQLLKKDRYNLNKTINEIKYAYIPLKPLKILGELLMYDIDMYAYKNKLTLKEAEEEINEALKDINIYGEKYIEMMNKIKEQILVREDWELSSSFSGWAVI